MAVFQILTSHEKIAMVGLRIFEYTSRRTKFQNQPISGFREKHFCSGTGEKTTLEWPILKFWKHSVTCIQKFFLTLLPGPSDMRTRLVFVLTKRNPISVSAGADDHLHSQQLISSLQDVV